MLKLIFYPALSDSSLRLFVFHGAQSSWRLNAALEVPQYFFKQVHARYHYYCSSSMLIITVLTVVSCEYCYLYTAYKHELTDGHDKLIIGMNTVNTISEV